MSPPPGSPKASFFHHITDEDEGRAVTDTPAIIGGIICAPGAFGATLRMPADAKSEDEAEPLQIMMVAPGAPYGLYQNLSATDARAVIASLSKGCDLAEANAARRASAALAKAAGK